MVVGQGLPIGQGEDWHVSSREQRQFPFESCASEEEATITISGRSKRVKSAMAALLVASGMDRLRSESRGYRAMGDRRSAC
ncbi:MAG: hypothetical protein CM15mP84_03800 [Cellvibrionales bacterium]|nr:MAG: hypothetical protein CM15mP84_03800 [Cellvibrionales bacterium]